MFPLWDFCIELLQDWGPGLGIHWSQMQFSCSFGSRGWGLTGRSPRALRSQSLHVLGWKTHFPRLSLPAQAGVGPPPGSSSVSRTGSLHKASAQPEEKKPETAGSRLERRDQLKKANTLPTSVTGSESRTVWT